jgi:hypothetical protein
LAGTYAPLQALQPLPNQLPCRIHFQSTNPLLTPIISDRKRFIRHYSFFVTSNCNWLFDSSYLLFFFAFFFLLVPRRFILASSALRLRKADSPGLVRFLLIPSYFPAWGYNTCNNFRLLPACSLSGYVSRRGVE